MTKRKDERRPPGPPKYRPTTEERQQIITGSAAGLSQNKIAKSIGRSRAMIKNTLNEPEIQQSIQQEKIELSKMYRKTARDIVVSINAADISKASLQQKAISSGILLDKSLLLMGEATEILDVRALMAVVDAIRERKVVEQENLQRAMRLPHLPPVIEAVPPAEPAKAPPKTSQQPASQGELQYFPVPLKAPDENG
jgi:predicted transcriptional regulator